MIENFPSIILKILYMYTVYSYEARFSEGIIDVMLSWTSSNNVQEKVIEKRNRK
jgi:hypothetical protein